MSSELEGKQQEVVSLQESLTTVQQEKDTLNQELGDLVSLFVYTMTKVALGWKSLIFFMLSGLL